MIRDPEAEADAWHANNALAQYAKREVWPLVKKLESLTNQARAHLAGPNLHHPDLEGVRAALLKALLDAGSGVPEQADRR